MPLKRLSSAPRSIGGMQYRVTLYLPGDRGTDGGTLPPSPAITTWGKFKSRPLRSKENDQPHQIAQVSEHIIEIPYQRGILESMTVGFQGRMFQINYIVDEDEGQFFLDIYCSEIGQNAGSQV